MQIQTTLLAIGLTLLTDVLVCVLSRFVLIWHLARKEKKRANAPFIITSGSCGYIGGEYVRSSI